MYESTSCLEGAPKRHLATGSPEPSRSGALIAAPGRCNGFGMPHTGSRREAGVVGVLGASKVPGMCTGHGAQGPQVHGEDRESIWAATLLALQTLT